MNSSPCNGSNAPSYCPSFKAYFRLTEDRHVRVYFRKQSLPTEVRMRHFGRGYFEMSTPFELPLKVLVKLGVDFYRINPGIYPVQEDSDFIQVVF